MIYPINKIPFFDRIHSVICLPTADGLAPGFMLIIAHDPSAGVKNRYMVLQINCQTGRIKRIGNELPLKFSKFIRDKAISELRAQDLAL